MKSKSKIISAAVTLVLIIASAFFVNNAQSTNQANDSKITETKIIQSDSASNQDLINLKYDWNQYKENYYKLNRENIFNADELANAAKKNNGKAWIEYGKLDSIGRATGAVSLITFDQVYSHSRDVVERPRIDQSVQLSGEKNGARFNASRQTWVGGTSNNADIKTKQFSGLLYNNSHLLAWSLGGDMQTHNLILGTRAQNAGVNDKGGMLNFELIVVNAIEDNHNLKVLYSVEPIYKGDELVARGVHLKAESIDSDKIRINVWVFNDQPGIIIDYQTGQWEYS